MKVLNLQCRHGHGFEGWFASEDDYQSQLGRGLVECPVCGDKEVSKLPSAPRLNLSGAREVPAAKPEPTAETAQSIFMRAVRHVLDNTEDVGERFPEEARRIHYGEVDARGIRGHATQEETAALLEEGIEVMPFPVPAALKEPLQ
jgi:hypothetical protein